MLCEAKEGIVIFVKHIIVKHLIHVSKVKFADHCHYFKSKSVFSRYTNSRRIKLQYTWIII